MTRTMILLAVLSVTATTGFAAEDPPKDTPATVCATDHADVTPADDCIRTKRRTRRSTSNMERRSGVFSGYDARVMAPTYLPGTAR
jgi:hypothetical protein